MSTTDTDRKAEHWECSSDEYHALSKVSVSHSELDTFIQSPKLYHGRYLTGIYPRETTAALDFGTVFHDIVLGPDYSIDRDNFNRGTVAMFAPTVRPPTEPDFVSDSDSHYWFSEAGVFRMSNHWGQVGSCYWGLSSGNVGYCNWRDFFHDDKFTLIPPDVLNADGHRKGAAWKEWEAENSGKIILKESEFKPVSLMLESLLSSEPARALLGGFGHNEYSIRWTDEETGIVCRCRLDRWKAADNIAVDLKSCRASKPEAFSKTALEYGYFRQAAMYQDGVEALTGNRPAFVFIAVEKDAPFSCEVFELDDEFVELGRRENRAGLVGLAQAHDSGVWESPTHGQIVTLSAPRWAKYRSEFELQ